MGVHDVTADVTGSVVLIELLVDYCKAVVDSRSRVSPPIIRREFLCVRIHRHKGEAHYDRLVTVKSQ